MPSLLKWIVITLLLLITGCGGNSNSDSSGAAGNQAPIAVISAPVTAQLGSSVTLDGSGSRDPEGKPLKYDWSIISHPLNSLSLPGGMSSASTAFTPDFDGEYLIRLVVMDPAGLTGTADLRMIVSSTANARPQIRSFTAVVKSVLPDGGTPTLLEWLAVDPNEDPLHCALDVNGDGPWLDFPDCTAVGSYLHVYPVSGFYRPRLIITDSHGAATYRDLVNPIPGDFAMSMVRPAQLQLVGDAMNVTFRVSGVRDVVAVNARVKDRSVPLLFTARADCSMDPAIAITYCPAYAGVVDMTGLATGEQALVIDVVDTAGARAYYYQRINYDNRPIVSVAAPLPESLARPMLPVKAACIDEDAASCVLTVSIDRSDIRFSGIGSVDTTLDLSRYDGKTVTLVITAKDARNQVAEVVRTVHVETSGRLSTVAELPGPIMDILGDRVLYRVVDADTDRVYIHDTTDGMSVQVPLPYGRRLRHGFLSTRGAVLQSEFEGVSGSARIHDWNNGALYDLASPNSSASLRVAGDYALWSEGGTLVRRTLTTREMVTISTTAGNWNNDVTETGAVAWWSSGTDGIYLTDGGLTTQLTPDGVKSAWVVTNGGAFVYGRSLDSGNYGIILNDGHAETILAQGFDGWPDSGYAFQIKDNWLVYADTGISGQRLVRIRQLTGASVLLASFMTSAYPELLGDSGQVMVISGGRRYLGSAVSPLTEVSSALGRSFCVNGHWYIAIGRVVLKLDH